MPLADIRRRPARTIPPFGRTSVGIHRPQYAFFSPTRLSYTSAPSQTTGLSQRFARRTWLIRIRNGSYNSRSIHRDRPAAARCEQAVRCLNQRMTALWRHLHRRDNASRSWSGLVEDWQRACWTHAASYARHHSRAWAGCDWSERDGRRRARRFCQSRYRDGPERRPVVLSHERHTSTVRLGASVRPRHVLPP
jgi:hypothetical protein